MATEHVTRAERTPEQVDAELDMEGAALNAETEALTGEAGRLFRDRDANAMKEWNRKHRSLMARWKAWRQARNDHHRSKP